LILALEGPYFIFNASTLSAINNIHPIGLALQQQWVFLHEVMSPGIMVSVTMILKTFEYVHLVHFASDV
jgi:hypothetical protein